MASEVIKLNLIPKGEMPVFHASQFDTGRLITCELYRGEDAYSVPEGYTVELHCRKVDNNIVTMASTLINDNVVTFTSTEQLTACNGNNLCEVAILDEGYRIGTLNFILEVEIDPLKGGITSTSEIHNLETQVEEITTEVIGENYYNKTEVDDLLDTKADSDSVYTIGEVNTLLSGKANAADVYTKSQTDTMLSAKANSSDVYTKGQVDTALATKADVSDLPDMDLYYTKTQVDSALALKANAADVYTKSQVDNIILDIMPVDTAGPASIASFDTALAADLVDCKTTLAPSLTGYTAVSLTACGVNLFDKSQVEVGYINDNNGQLIHSAGSYSSGYIPIKGDQNYYIKTEQTGSAWGAWYDSTKTYISGITGYATGAVKTAPANACYARFTIKTPVTGNIDTFGLNYPSTDTTYHAYTGNTYAIALGDTYYGGTLDVTRGVLTVEYDSSLQPITPYDVQLTPTAVRAIVGANNVYADTGDTTVQYKDTIQNYIDKKVST